MSNEKLKDAKAAFTFSRLPRWHRIAITLWEIMQKNDFNSAEVNFDEQIAPIAKELAQYSVKDFAVRYGHLADGKA
jgi:hypothetical protein